MAKVTSIEAKISSSAKIRDVFHSFSFGITLSVEDEDNLEEVKKKAWATCEREVEFQIEQVLEEERR